MFEKLAHALAGYRAGSDASYADYADAAAAALARSAAAVVRPRALSGAALATLLIAALFAGATATALAVAAAAAVLPAHPAARITLLALGGANVFVGLPMLAIRAAEVLGDRWLGR